MNKHLNNASLLTMSMKKQGYITASEETKYQNYLALMLAVGAPLQSLKNAINHVIYDIWPNHLRDSTFERMYELKRYINEELEKGNGDDYSI